MTARIDPADVAAVVARLTEFGAHVEAATVTALATDLAASRVAVRSAIQRKDTEIARLREATSTVGAMLATAPVGTIVEFRLEGRWWQTRVVPSGVAVESRTCAGSQPWDKWRDGQLLAAFIPCLACQVAEAEADADPRTRWPIGGAP